jgi:glycosyltransferase involved in cell wall biosynthesis
MTKQPVYSKFNSYRKPQFGTATEILNLDSKYKVLKVATNEENKDFLKSLKTTHDLLTESNPPIKVHNIKIVDEYTVELEYIEGKTLLNELKSCTLNNSKKECLKRFDEFSNLLNKFPTENKSLSENFEKIFGEVETREKYKVINPGILDLNLDNIIKGENGELTLIDFEWTFDFGIPKRYILYRAIYGSYIALRDTLSKVIDIEEAERAFGFSEEEIKKYLRWEVNFQHYVTGRRDPLEKIFKERKNLSVKTVDKDIKVIQKENLKQLYLEKERIQKENKDLSKDLQNLKKENHKLNLMVEEFKSFKKGKIWRALSIYRNLKRKMRSSFSRSFEITRRLFSYIIAFPRLLTEFPLKEFPLRVYVALRFVKQNEYNRDYQIHLRQNQIDDKYREKALEEISNFDRNPLISIIMPVYNVDVKWIKKAVNSVKKQIYTNWELCIADDASTSIPLKKYLEKINTDPQINVVFREKNGHISEASNTAIELAKGDFIVLMDNDDVIHPQSLYKVAKVINENPTVGLIYSDEDKMELNGTRCDPIFKSDYSPDYLLSTNYFCHLTSIRKDLVDRVGGFRRGYEGSQDYDLFLRVVELIEKEDIIHIPEVLYSWRKIPGSTALTYDQKGYAQIASFKALQDTLKRRNIDGVISEGLQGGFFRIKYNIREKPLISIIITTEEINNNLKKCIRTILKETAYQNFEILLISTDKEKKHIAEDKRVSFYHFDEEYNIPKIRNYGVEKSNGEYIVILDENTKIINPDWLEGLLEYAQRENTGAVGPRILSKDGEVLCTSFWLDENNNVINIHNSLPPHMQVRANLVANYTIISDICFMISKEKYKSVENHSNYKDSVSSWINFFVNVSTQGLYNTYTPFVKISYCFDKIPVKKIEETKKGHLKNNINALRRKLL